MGKEKTQEDACKVQVDGHNSILNVGGYQGRITQVLISSRETGLLNISKLQVNEIKSFCVYTTYTTEVANIQVDICQCLDITSHVKINNLGKKKKKKNPGKKKKKKKKKKK